MTMPTKIVGNIMLLLTAGESLAVAIHQGKFVFPNIPIDGSEASLVKLISNSFAPTDVEVDMTGLKQGMILRGIGKDATWFHTFSLEVTKDQIRALGFKTTLSRDVQFFHPIDHFCMEQHFQLLASRQPVTVTA